MSASNAKKLILRPSAARLLESMRDIGYSFESALADILDNSISAGCAQIFITNDVDPETGPYVAILDDGCGMLPEELTRAMQHGSRGPREVRETGDLGRFGLGLKTASFSQCRQLTVVSRKDNELTARRWDLDLVVESDEWILELLDDMEIKRLPIVDLIGEHGTLVLWQKLDRLDALGEESRQAYEALNELFAAAKPHLALTFHRFLAPEPAEGIDKVSISINGAQVEPNDPFARHDLPRSDAHNIEVIRMSQGEITVQAFTLPHHQRLSGEQLRALERGSSLVETQGLYVYRARRLISGGNWLGLARRAELTKLLRVRVDVPTDLDAEWSVDVRKSRVRPPAAVRSRLRPIVERMTESARRPYTYRGSRQASGSGFPVWERVVERGKIRYELNREHPLVKRLSETHGERSDLEPLLLAVEASLPLDSLFSDIGGDPHGVGQAGLDDQELERLIAGFVEALAPDSDALPISLADKILDTTMFAGKPEARKILHRLRRIESD